ncbi:hypothetical protein BKA58DRAFT_434622 [Alternaria rosae]|uniref:uncharacterized protein n=1 Tax=Alternaria rosae TaxID=1187941 RepID=UPI001E8E83D9|nr:uncharacterized protein BKA58DRAFT_434622 [Alternaria rosae]KAH6882861.1 hypothetical protein BKA58DRAFT_434622 [Alternaria rosae]
MVNNENPISIGESKHADQLEIALYDPKPTDQNASSATSSVSRNAYYGASHRALDVVELLKQILSHASPRTHYAAWNVSRRWREIVIHMLDMQYRAPYPYVAVEQGGIVPPSLRWLPPCEDEITRLQNTFNITTAHAYSRSLSDPFLIARFTQADTLPQQLFTSLHNRIRSDFRLYRSPSFYSLAEEPRWLDLSQVEVNPYFVHLCGDCFQPFQGNYTISIKPRIKDYLGDSSSTTGPFWEQLIHNMFLGRPTCKVLRIYAIGKIHEEVQALGTHSSTATELWRTRSKSLREEIIGHTTPVEIHKAWNCPGFPKLAVFLESTAQSGPPFAHHPCDINTRNIYMHKTEWHEDHLKPTRIFAGNPELRDPRLDRP